MTTPLVHRAMSEVATKMAHHKTLKGRFLRISNSFRTGPYPVDSHHRASDTLLAALPQLEEIGPNMKITLMTDPSYIFAPNHTVRTVIFLHVSYTPNTDERFWPILHQKLAPLFVRFRKNRAASTPSNANA